ncbi:MAG: glycosyltransferase family 2 protein [Myxococcota bacterium]
MGDIDLSVLILSWNTRDMTLACLRSLARDAPRRPREIIVVDNGSEDGSADAVARDFPDVRLIANPDNRFYSGGNNQAAAAAAGRHLCLLNSDTEVTPGALDTMVDWLEAHPAYAGVAPKMLDFDGSIQPACSRLMGILNPLCDSTSLGRFPPGSWIRARTRMADFDHLESRDVEQPCTSALVIRADDFHRVGGFDPRLLVFFTDVDLCRRLLKRGRRLRYLADVAVYHHLGGSTQRSPQRSILWLRDRNAYYRKHYGAAGDLFMRAVLWLYAAELIARIKLGPRRGEQERNAVREVLDEVRAVAATRDPVPVPSYGHHGAATPDRG